MTSADFYLACFVVGFALSVLAFLGVHLHLPFHFHCAHGPAGPGTAHGAGHGRGRTTVTLARAKRAGFHLSIRDVHRLSRMVRRHGLLLTRYSRVWFTTGLVVALAVGFLGGYIIYVFMAKVLMSPDAVLDPEISGWKACSAISPTRSAKAARAS
jgi:hypothetical protein